MVFGNFVRRWKTSNSSGDARAVRAGAHLGGRQLSMKNFKQQCSVQTEPRLEPPALQPRTSSQFFHTTVLTGMLWPKRWLAPLPERWVVQSCAGGQAGRDAVIPWATTAQPTAYCQ